MDLKGLQEQLAEEDDFKTDDLPTVHIYTPREGSVASNENDSIQASRDNLLESDYANLDDVLQQPVQPSSNNVENKDPATN